MRCSHPASFHQQVNFLRSQFLLGDDLRFSNVLTEEVVGKALTTISGWSLEGRQAATAVRGIGGVDARLRSDVWR
jgi:hypothetical protein